MAPPARPSWMAAEPTPPAPAWTSSVSPGCSRARWKRPTHPVWYVMMSADAATSSRLAGTGNACGARASVCSDRPPHGRIGMAATRWPASRPVTPVPTACTVPATSRPGENGRAGRSWYWPRQYSASGKFRADAATSISTCPGPGSGAGTSSSTSTSVGSPSSCTRHDFTGLDPNFGELTRVQGVYDTSRASVRRGTGRGGLAEALVDGGADPGVGRRHDHKHVELALVGFAQPRVEVSCVVVGRHVGGQHVGGAAGPLLGVGTRRGDGRVGDQHDGGPRCVVRRQHPRRPALAYVDLDDR